MSYLEDFEQWKGAIEAIPLDEVKQPDSPVDDYVARCEALAVTANDDREALGGAGLDVAFIDQLNPLSGALRYCQAQWMSIFRIREGAKREWDEQAPAGFELRNELLHHFSFAYRNDDNLLKMVMRIREGNSRADMVQDLINLAIHGENHPAPLSEINLIEGSLQRARTLSHDLSEVLSVINGAKDDGNAVKRLRDQAFTLLAEKDRIIREYGRYIFWKDDDRREQYTK